MMKLSLGFLLLVFSFTSAAKLRVVATTEDLSSLTRMLGGDEVEVSAIARGTQDPHFIEAKPSFMVRLSRADLVFSIGLGLEQGWLPLLLRGARQPKLLPGNAGYQEVSEAITPIEVIEKADRSDGDVHPFGNPHFMGDPERGLLVAGLISKKLKELDGGSATKYTELYAKFEKEFVQKITGWKKRLAPLKGLNLIGYHKTFNYFYAFAGLNPVGYIEPKPGIPPTPQHTVKLIEVGKAAKVRFVVIENYFENRAAKAVAEGVGAKLLVLPAYTGGDEKSPTYEQWLERLVSAFEKGE